MLKDKIAAFIEEIRAVDGVTACALVSRDGIIAGKYFDRDLNEPWFGLWPPPSLHLRNQQEILSE